MRQYLTNSQLEYLDNLIELINTSKNAHQLSLKHFVGITMGDEIDIIHDVRNRTYIDLDRKIQLRWEETPISEADIINSWKEWYISALKQRKVNQLETPYRDHLIDRLF